MLIIKDMGGDTVDGVNSYLNFENHEINSDSDVLMYGINTTLNFGLQKKFSDFKSKKLLNLWAPCEFTQVTDPVGQNAFQQFKYFDKVYNICPYTTKWLNSMFDKTKHEYIFYPFGDDVIPTLEEKIYDVCYFGGIHGIDHVECINEISSFNYRFISQQNHHKVTNLNVPFKEKLKIVSQCKISVCYNLLHFRSDQQRIVKTYDRWNENEAFHYMDDNGRVPQFKQRVHESAFSKTLILCKKDYWNIIEDYYEPNVDFLYFDDNKDLKKIITDILNNYSDYQTMIDNAYSKSMNYKVVELYKLIKDNKEWKK